ncbi:oxidoreductase [Cellulomonas endophytica]|uniref:oxidoreductase n=1 Tax=Cellulomonas endophytica TaxID=2494735 RepID=UPI001F0C1061|nr:oxidoreductase [Cellulomonas endophytica]
MGILRRMARRLRPRRSDGSAAPGAALPTGRAAREATAAYLGEFVRTHVGVEAYVEPVTRVTPATVMLVATDGEWTRRRVPDTRAAFLLARELGIPAYDVQRTGYPQRMRDWNSRQRILQRRRAARG